MFKIQEENEVNQIKRAEHASFSDKKVRKTFITVTTRNLESYTPQLSSRCITKGTWDPPSHHWRNKVYWSPYDYDASWPLESITGEKDIKPCALEIFVFPFAFYIFYISEKTPACFRYTPIPTRVT